MWQLQVENEHYPVFKMDNLFYQFALSISIG